MFFRRCGRTLAAAVNTHTGSGTKSETLTFTCPLKSPCAISSSHLQIPGLLIYEVRRLGEGSSGSDRLVCAAQYLFERAPRARARKREKREVSFLCNQRQVILTRDCRRNG
jgi:hypothetical protein